jgi:hypothetical protein
MRRRFDRRKAARRCWALILLTGVLLPACSSAAPKTEATYRLQKSRIAQELIEELREDYPVLGQKDPALFAPPPKIDRILSKSSSKAILYALVEVVSDAETAPVDQIPRAMVRVEEIVFNRTDRSVRKAAILLLTMDVNIEENFRLMRVGQRLIIPMYFVDRNGRSYIEFYNAGMYYVTERNIVLSTFLEGEDEQYSGYTFTDFKAIILEDYESWFSGSLVTDDATSTPAPPSEPLPSER